MECSILFMHGSDFFDVRKDDKLKYKEMNIFEEDLLYEKEESYYFTEIDTKKSKIYDFDSDKLTPVVRSHGKFYYIFLVNKENPLHTPYVMFHEGVPLALKNFTFIVEDYLLPKFGINLYYYDYETSVNKKIFLIRNK
jgi:hypothetical protein